MVTLIVILIYREIRHMFIVSHLSGVGFLELFSTHPPLEERIARLEAMRAGA